MAKTRIATSPITGTIYYGNVLVNGNWGAKKKDVTKEACEAVFEHLLQTKTDIHYTRNDDGKVHVLQVRGEETMKMVGDVFKLITETQKKEGSPDDIMRKDHIIMDKIRKRIAENKES